MKLFLLLCVICALCGLTSCASYNERLKIRMAMEDYWDSQMEFARIYSGQIEEFERYARTEVKSEK